MPKILFSAVTAVALALPLSVQADTTELKTALQSGLQRSIERLMIDGALNQMNLETGEMEKFYPVETHASIVVMGDHYVMCSDLKRPDGTSVQVDYYLTKKGARYALVQTEIDRRAELKALIKAGKAKMLK